MAAMDVQVRIRAIDQFSKTLDRLQRKLRDLDKGRGGVADGDLPGAALGRDMGRRRSAMPPVIVPPLASKAEPVRDHTPDLPGSHGASAAAAGGAAAVGDGAGLSLGGLVAGAAIGVGIKQAVSAAADFETSLTNIQKKAGSTAAQIKALGEEIKDLATSGELAVSIDEIAAGYERGAAAGIPLEDLRQFALLSAKAADAFEMSSADVANASAGFTTVLGVPMDGMERYFDLINGLADAGIADESGIVDYIDRAGAMSKTFGLSANETAAFGAALANLKVPAERASTAMNSVLTKILAPNALSGDAREALGALVGDFGEFGKTIKKDASGALVGLLGKLKELDSVARTEIIAQLFGQDHLDVVSQMVEGLDEVKRNLAYAAGDGWFGSLDTSYKLKLDDFWSQWQVMKNALGRLMIDAGTMGMPALKAGLEGVIALIGQIDHGLKQFEARVDWSSVNEAKTAVSDLANQIGETLGVNTSDSSVLVFFQDLARAVNEVAAGVKAAKDGLDWLADPMGLNTPEGKRDAPPDDGKKWFEDFRANNVRPGSIADTALSSLGGWMDTADANHEAANPPRPADDLNIPPEQTIGAMKTDRPRPAAYDPFAAGRFPPPAAASPPQMDPALIDRLRQQLSSAPVADLGISTGAIPLPTARPEIDTTAFLSGVTQIETAKAGIASPVMATADMNIAPLLSKVEQAKAAVRSLDAMSATVGAGGGGNFNARVRDQF